MSYALQADLVVSLHFLFILFVLFGGLPAVRWPRLAVVHLAAAAWGVYIELSGGICPLTPLENMLRARAGSAGYTGGFIAHYLEPVIYPHWLSRPVQLLLAAIVILLNLAIYRFVWRAVRR